MKRLAMIAGIIFVAVGIMGFVPALTPDGRLLGLFAVDAMHNGVHIVTGLLGLGMAMAGEAGGRNYFRIVGVLYALVTLLGFVAGRDGQVLGMAMNMADHILHLGIAVIALWLGFGYHRELHGRGGPGLSGA